MILNMTSYMFMIVMICSRSFNLYITENGMSGNVTASTGVASAKGKYKGVDMRQDNGTPAGLEVDLQGTASR